MNLKLLEHNKIYRLEHYKEDVDYAGNSFARFEIVIEDVSYASSVVYRPINHIQKQDMKYLYGKFSGGYFYILNGNGEILDKITEYDMSSGDMCTTCFRNIFNDEKVYKLDLPAFEKYSFCSLKCLRKWVDYIVGITVSEYNPETDKYTVVRGASIVDED